MVFKRCNHKFNLKVDYKVQVDCEIYPFEEEAYGDVFVEGINEGSKVCEVDSDCLVFGESGDCNCGCFNKNALPQEPVGDCFCAAPTSCECIDNICEGIF